MLAELWRRAPGWDDERQAEWRAAVDREASAMLDDYLAEVRDLAVDEGVTWH